MTFISNAGDSITWRGRFCSRRLSPLWLFGLLFLVVQTTLRAVLTFNSYAGFPPGSDLLAIFTTGFLYDLVVYAYFAVPLGVLLVSLPARWGQRLWLRIAFSAAVAMMMFVLLFTAAAEWFFWQEFSARFDFIAVDYLIYTQEVIGNIWQSYPVGKILIALGLLALAITLGLGRLMRPALAAPLRASVRAAVAIGLLAAPLAASYGVRDSWRTESHNGRENMLAGELGGNGIHSFFAALRNNELDFKRHYAMVDSATALAVQRHEIASSHDRFVPGRINPIEHLVSSDGAPQHFNIVLISVESLGANFLGSFGNQERLTPNLDTLAKQSRFYTQIYATGTRTVRGLEALSLSLPPTPGQSIVKRPHNEGLMSLGQILKDRGYDTKFIYGGYGYFDNMNYFFANNGYAVVDRTAIPKERIHHENIWGVADEDLFDAALREFDASAAKGKPFFAHVMTTSNHRPYTYPANRIDIPSGTSREGAVKYTDWAIGHFIAEARKHPWFDNTVFVITADHTAGGRGKAELDPQYYHIPLLVYAPKHIRPERFEKIASQIDIPPTILGLLNVSYQSRFFGRNLSAADSGDERIFIGNYQTVGFAEHGVLVSLSPRQKVSVRTLEPVDGNPEEVVREAKTEAIAMYQTASYAFRNGLLRN